MYRNLRTRDEAVHNMKSMAGTKVEPAPKLHARKLWLSCRKGTNLKRKRLFSLRWIVLMSVVNIKGMNVILHRLRPVPINR
jgi:hypothetical protein